MRLIKLSSAQLYDASDFREDEDGFIPIDEIAVVAYNRTLKLEKQIEELKAALKENK